MNLKLGEWNELIEHGNKCCDALKIFTGHDVRLKPYTMSDGSKGLSIQVLDAFGEVFAEYRSGIDTYENMKAMINKISARIHVEFG